jgi:PAS domain S-box-containing protein
MLQHQQENYCRILDQFPNPIWRSGVDGKCNFFNVNWLAFTGRTMEQEMGDGWTDGVHTDELKKCSEDYLTSFNKREAFMLKYRLKHADGTYHWLLDYGSPFFTTDDVFLGYIGSCYDINELEISKGLLYLTGVMTKTGGWELDVLKNTLHWTDEVYRIHEVENDLVLRVEDAKNFYIGESKTKISDALTEAISVGTSFDIELQLKTGKGNLLWVRSFGRAQQEGGKTVKVFGTVQDITEVKHSQLLVQEKIVELEALNKVMIGRELMMIELKEKIRELENTAV